MEFHLLSAIVWLLWNPDYFLDFQSSRSVILDGGSVPIWQVLAIGSGSLWKQGKFESSVKVRRSEFQKLWFPRI